MIMSIVLSEQVLVIRVYELLVASSTDTVITPVPHGGDREWLSSAAVSFPTGSRAFDAWLDSPLAEEEDLLDMTRPGV